MAAPSVDRVRTSFDRSAEDFVRTVRQIRGDQLAWPGLGDWTVLELLGHTARSFLLIQQLLSAPVDGLSRLSGPDEYFRSGLAASGIHQQIASRGAETAAQLGADPVAGAVSLAESVQQLVRATPDDAPIAYVTGWLTFVDYLQTRTLELVVHTVDLQRATGQRTTVDPDALQDVLQLLVELADRADPVALLLALTGRAPLPADFNVLA